MRLRRWVTAVLLGLGVALLLTAPAFAADVFPDVPSDHTYRVAIEDLASRGIIGGYTNKNFGPEDPVMRQQFAKMIVKTLGLPVSMNDICSFEDTPNAGVDDPLYPDKYVAVCAQHNITKGKDATHFDPFAYVTRQQLITMVVRTVDIQEIGGGYAPPFAAGQFYPEEHYLNAKKAAAQGLLSGLQGVGPAYSFFAPATRGECAQILWNLSAYIAEETTYETVDVQTAYDQLSQNPEAQLVDVREPAEWADTGVPQGALFIPVGEIEQRALAELAMDKPVYVICKSGKRSQTAAEILIGLGYSEVYNVDGGITAWIQAGLLLERYPPDDGGGEEPCG